QKVVETTEVSYVGVGYASTEKFNQLSVEGRYVYTLQLALRKLDIDVGIPDGVAGAETLEGFRQFLREQNLPVAGGFTPEHGERLISLAKEKINSSGGEFIEIQNHGIACLGNQVWCESAKSENRFQSERPIAFVRVGDVPDLESYISQNRLGNPSQISQVLLVDLDKEADGKEELVLELSGKSCKGNECEFLILKQQDNGWFYPLLPATSGHSIAVSSGATHCFSALSISNVNAAKGEVRNSAYLFDGRRYLDSATYYAQGNSSSSSFDCPAILAEVERPIEIALDSQKPDNIISGQGNDELEQLSSNTSEDDISGSSVPSAEEIAKQNELQLARAAYIKQKLIRDFDQVFELVRRDVTLVSRYFKIKENDAFRPVIEGAYPHVGCFADENSVVGYYNVGMHVWIILWLDENDQIVNAKLSSGFSPKENSELNNAWYQLFRPDMTVMQALQKAAEIQTRSFELLYPFEDCVSPDQMDLFFTTDEAVYSIWENRKIKSEFPVGVIDQVERKTSEKHNVSNLNRAVLSVAIGEFGSIDLLTIYNLVNDPSASLVQVWRLDQSTPVLEAEEIGRVFSGGDQ
ncbi:MAG: hypothetical protein AAFR02_06405, partial [Pseudomonadota bacterium]